LSCIEYCTANSQDKSSLSLYEDQITSLYPAARSVHDPACMF